MEDKVQKNEERVDAALTEIQGLLEKLKKSPHTAWIVLIVGGTILLVAGLVVIFL